MIRIIETIRDGLQGLDQFVSLEKKVEYANAILKVGFDAVDIGSFVSPKAVPQMADTGKLIRKLDLSKTNSKLMALVANKKGAEIGAEYDELDYLIYPFTISETFLKKNINADFNKSEATIDDILNICTKRNKKVVIYISMAFGNPYGDKWSVDTLLKWVEKLAQKGISEISISDTIGLSSVENITKIYSAVISKYPAIEFGFHLHTKPNEWYEKVDAAYQSGCRWFDSVMGGLGGCPMTGYELLSNLDTRNLDSYFTKNNIATNLDKEMLKKSSQLTHGLLM
jgi:hydroxymethylglutaryl-CoA lyase